MASRDTLADGNDGACWQCGAPARAECAYPLKLVAPAGCEPDALGYPVTSARGREMVVVAVPRCPACRGRGQDAIVILFAGMIAGAIIAPILQSLFWPNAELPPWIHILTHRHAPVGAVSAVGSVVGAVVAIVAVALNRRRRGFKSLNSYPPVRALQKIGWHFPS